MNRSRIRVPFHLLAACLFLQTCQANVFFSSTTNSTNDDSIQTRIIGGSRAKQYPYYVHVIDGELCGGSLIASDFVLTAAHCVSAYQSDVLVGSTDLYGSDATSQTVRVQKRYQHPDYVPGPELNDIMLVQLKTTVPGDEWMQLNTDANLPEPDQKVTAMGFGLTSQGGSVSDDLMEVTTSVVDPDYCKQLLGDVVWEQIHICAGELAGGKDTCGGDSGGPLIDTKSGIQYGVVSFGFGCAQAYSPGVYTRVSYYSDWIQETVCTNSQDAPPFCKDAPAPTNSPTRVPTPEPTAEPTPKRTLEPTAAPTVQPTKPPTEAPTVRPTATPTLRPTKRPTEAPTLRPTARPTTAPTESPTTVPTAVPTESPTRRPTDAPSARPSPQPSVAPSAAPSTIPTVLPTASPSAVPTLAPTVLASAAPSILDVTKAVPTRPTTSTNNNNASPPIAGAALSQGNTNGANVPTNFQLPSAAVSRSTGGAVLLRSVVLAVVASAVIGMGW